MGLQQLHDFLRSIGFHDSRADPSLFIYKNFHTIFLLVYVNDIVVKGSKENEVQRASDQIRNEFATRKLGELNFLLGFK